MQSLLISPLKRYPVPVCSVSLLYLLFSLSLPHISALSPFMLADDSSQYGVKCGECDESRCPVLSYCEGKAIKDSCNCCTVCSSPKYQPHATVVGGELAAPPSGSGSTSSMYEFSCHQGIWGSCKTRAPFIKPTEKLAFLPERRPSLIKVY